MRRRLSMIDGNLERRGGRERECMHAPSAPGGAMCAETTNCTIYYQNLVHPPEAAMRTRISGQIVKC